jgi:hypothetical protein
MKAESLAKTKLIQNQFISSDPGSGKAQGNTETSSKMRIELLSRTK